MKDEMDLFQFWKPEKKGIATVIWGAFQLINPKLQKKIYYGAIVLLMVVLLLLVAAYASGWQNGHTAAWNIFYDKIDQSECFCK